MLSKSIHYIGLNFVSQERLDPILYYFLYFLGLGQNQFLYVCLELLVLAAGMSLLLLVTRAKGGSFVGIWAMAVLVIVLGLEPFYLKFQWFPWLLTGLILLLVRGTMASFLVAAFLSLLWIFSAGSIAPLGIILASFAAVIIALRMRSYTVVIAEGGRSYTLYCLLTLVAFLCSVAFIPKYPMPDYPPEARLAVDSLFSFLPHPLLGDRLNPIPVVGSVYVGLLALYLQNYLLVLVSVVIGLGVSAILWGESVRVAQRQILYHALVVLVLIGSFLFWPASSIAWQPFVMLMRIVPGLGHSFLPWMILPFSLLFLAVGTFADCSRRVICTSLVCCLFVAGLLIVAGRTAPTQAHFAEFGVVSEANPYVGISWSPSASVVAIMGHWITIPGVSEQRKFSNLKRLIKTRDYELKEVSAAPNLASASRAVDGNVFTSWGTGRSQASGDFYSLSFIKPINIARVALSIQETPQSFPCSMGVWGRDNSGIERELYRQDPWPGPVFWTKSGFPYFGDKRHVVIDFPNRQEVLGLRFEILSSRCANRGWSIGEVKLYDIYSTEESNASD